MTKPGSCWLVCEDLGGLRSQVKGLAEVAGIAAEERLFTPHFPWKMLAPRLWPVPLTIAGLAPPFPDLAIGCGGKAAAAIAALRSPRTRGVIIQNPRLDPKKFDLIVAGPHDGIAGPNVVVARTAIHGITQEKLATSRTVWAPRFAHLPRPLVAVLVGGANGRFRFDTSTAKALADQLASMMRLDRVGLMLTPSRRTADDARTALAQSLAPEGAYIWDMTGENPYLGMLACADAIVVTEDSVSMVSEAIATTAPVLLASLPGRSRRIRAFTSTLLDCGRVRRFAGRLELWPAEPLNDTPMVAAEMGRRFGYG